MSPQHFNNFTGCQYNIVSPSNFVYSCTKYTQNEYHPTLLIKSLPQQIFNPVLVCARPVPANIRLQGHVSNSAREAFPMQDLLRGTVSHITFEISRTLRDSKDNIKLFCFKGRSSTFKLLRFRFIATFIHSFVKRRSFFMQVFYYEL